MNALDGKVALVTGGARGIGRAICEAMADAGARVAVADLNAADAAQTAQAIDGISVAVDVTNFDALATCMQDVEAQLGGIDILVNNAGIFNMASIDKITVEDYRRQYDVNVGGTIFACQAVAPIMRKRGGGSIINFSSISYMMGNAGYHAYVAAKAGITGMTRGFAREYGPKRIRANSVMPGWVLTERQMKLWATPQALENMLKRQCLPEHLHEADLVHGVLFLASDASRMMTSQALVIDGGVVVTG